jgi:hypothetical protein
MNVTLLRDLLFEITDEGGPTRLIVRSKILGLEAPVSPDDLMTLANWISNQAIRLAAERRVTEEAADRQRTSTPTQEHV